jgi:PBSX family phage terminase large subunit
MKKQIYRLSHKIAHICKDVSKAKFRLFDGPVRSGKTYIANYIALRDIQDLPPCNVLLSGYSISTAARNIIASWKESIDPLSIGLFRMSRVAKDDYVTIDWRGLRGKKFYVRGASKESDYKAIQGATFGYWVADEFTRHHESFTDMAMTRLSQDYAKGVFTTNADSPYHYVKRRFIDDSTLYTKDIWRRYQFALSDNPSLSDEYKAMLDATYTGVFYRRFVHNEWCVAEGVIYDLFDEKCIIDSPPPAKFHVVGIDYGTTNPTVFILFGVNPTGKPCIWAEREFFYDSSVTGHQKTDDEYADDFTKFLGGIRPAVIYPDPSAASFIQALRRRGYTTIQEADNSVLDGIRTQARLLHSGMYKVCRKCEHTIKDYGAYSWDKSAQARGEDKPLKTNDHTKDAERYPLHTRYGQQGPDLAMLARW